MKRLTLDEMHWVLKGIKHPLAEHYCDMMTNIGTDMASDIATAFGVQCRGALSGELDFCRISAAFFAASPSQPCPAPLAAYDAEDWTDERGNPIEKEA